MSNQEKPQQQQQQQQQGIQQQQSLQQKQPPSDTEPLIIEEKVQIVNGEHIVKKYQRGGLLGKGGFAKCFQVTNLENKKVMAAKIIPKNTLVKNRARQKLISEIKIHKSLHHNNIVKFEHVFEDHDNVYILLELCPHQTLNELIKRRKRITELETLCYTVQIVQALKYLHQNRVIHRDLKLGNLFMGDKMEIKVGDFGLATKLEFDGEKKRTICGTPNYIAPEILDGRVGHSYEVDVWSLGVIIYTLLIGKPPFETQDVKTTYRRIKANQYSFPDHAPIPDSAKALIQLILVQDPSKRPTLDEILAHPFISNGGTIPKLLPVSTLTTAPNASYIKQYAPTASNLKANQQSIQMYTEAFSSRNKDGIGRSQTSTNIMKGVDQQQQQQPQNNYYPDDKKNTQNNNQFMSSANLQSNKNNQFGGTAADFNRPQTGSKQPELSRTGTQQQLQSQQQVQQNQQQQPNRYQSVQNLMNNNGQQQQQNQQNIVEEVRQIDGSKNNLWVVQYVDYSSKYGLGYILSNRSSGVIFNDTTKIILDPTGEYFEYIYRKEQEELTEKHTISNYPTELQKKVTLLQHFRHYLMNSTNNSNNFNDANLQDQGIQPNQPLPYLKKWMQTRHAIMFRLSNKIVQVQFSDKTEILLNSIDKIVSFKNKKGERSHYPLADAMNSNNTDMTKRLKYTKEILTHLLKNNNVRQQNNNNNNNGNNDQEGQNIPNNINPPDDLGATDNFKYTGVQSGLNDNNNNIGDPFAQNKLGGGKGMVSQKSLTDKDQFVMMGSTTTNKLNTQSQQQQSQQQLKNNNQIGTDKIIKK